MPGGFFYYGWGGAQEGGDGEREGSSRGTRVWESEIRSAQPTSDVSLMEKGNKRE